MVIHKHPEVNHLIHVCLGRSFKDDGANDLDVHMQNLSPLCFDKWIEFSRLYQLLMESDKKLRGIVQKCQLDNGIELITENETINYVCEIENCDSSSQFHRYDRAKNDTSNQGESVLFNIARQQNHHNNIELISENVNSSVEVIKNDDIEFADSSYQSKQVKQIGRCRETATTNRIVKRKSKSKQKQFQITPTKETPNISTSFKTLSDCKGSSTKKVLYRCEPCKKYFYGVHKYEGHVKQVHEGIKKAYECKDCSKAYPFYKNLRDHIALNHSVKPLESFKCEECTKVFKTKVTLKTHQESKHRNVSKCIICDQCGFMAANQYGLKKHIKNKHSLAEKIKCDHCPKVFKNPYYLKYHMLNFHNPMNIKPFKCTDCNMAFTRTALLNVHKRTHLKPSERIKCDFEGCEVRFLFNGEKARHMRLVHLKVKNYVCDICGDAFGTGPTLRHHRYIHTGDKPFKCNICGQGFRQRSAMKTHQKTHGPKEEAVARLSDIKINNLSENIVK